MNAKTAMSVLVVSLLSACGAGPNAAPTAPLPAPSAGAPRGALPAPAAQAAEALVGDALSDPPDAAALPAAQNAQTVGFAGASTADPTLPATEVPAVAACGVAAGWPRSWAAYEDAVLAAVNAVRAQGADCGGKAYGPAAPLVADGALRCAARNHAMDMAVKQYFSHSSQDGSSPWDRMAAAGYAGGAKGENIAAGQKTPDDVVSGWVASPGHCRNLMAPSFSKIGVGFYLGNRGMRFYWVQDFGS